MSDEPTLSDFGSGETADDTEEPANRDAASSEAGDAERASERAAVAETEPVGDDTEPTSEETEPMGDDTEPTSEETEPMGDDAEATSEGRRLSTYAWGAYTCSHCGGETDRVWRADGEFVCPECKAW